MFLKCTWFVRPVINTILILKYLNKWQNLIKIIYSNQANCFWTKTVNLIILMDHQSEARCFSRWHIPRHGQETPDCTNCLKCFRMNYIHEYLISSQKRKETKLAVIIRNKKNENNRINIIVNLKRREREINWLYPQSDVMYRLSLRWSSPTSTHESRPLLRPYFNWLKINILLWFHMQK